MNNIKSKAMEGAGKTPGERLWAGRMPGHWLLARLENRMPLPGGSLGGIGLTREMLYGLGIGSLDQVVEFTLGLGSTVRLALGRGPHSYIGVERDEAAGVKVRRRLGGQDTVGEAEARRVACSHHPDPPSRRTLRMGVA